MRGLLAAIIVGAAIAASAAEADEAPPVVVELYTSQGCSSCPPADALLAELAHREDVIPLALHVDYWDYIGWKDAHAQPAFTKRQKAYAHAAGERTIYTPQMIVGGKDHVVGYKPMRLAELIEAHNGGPAKVSLDVSREGDRLRIAAKPNGAPAGPLLVQLVRYIPEDTVDIGRGENAGRTITYSNIVTEWRALGEWDGQGPLDLTAEAAGDAPVVVVLQRPGPGAILAAARLR